MMYDFEWGHMYFHWTATYQQTEYKASMSHTILANLGRNRRIKKKKKKREKKKEKRNTYMAGTVSIYQCSARCTAKQENGI